jgi:hypothetical protein
MKGNKHYALPISRTAQANPSGLLGSSPTKNYKITLHTTTTFVLLNDISNNNCKANPEFIS